MINNYLLWRSNIFGQGVSPRKSPSKLPRQRRAYPLIRQQFNIVAQHQHVGIISRPEARDQSAGVLPVARAAGPPDWDPGALWDLRRGEESRTSESEETPATVDNASTDSQKCRLEPLLPQTGTPTRVGTCGGGGYPESEQTPTSVDKSRLFPSLGHRRVLGPAKGLSHVRTDSTSLTGEPGTSTLPR